MKSAWMRVVQRLGWALLVIFGVTTVSFVVEHVLPGDPARMLVGPQASLRDVERARALYDLDQPLPERYARFWMRLLHTGPRVEAEARKLPEHRSCWVLGPLHIDLGYSFHYRQPVVDLVAARLPRSLELALAALAAQLAFGLGLGVLAAARRGTRWDELAVGTSLVGMSAPTFLTALLLQYVLAYKLKLLPYDGYGKTTTEHLASLVLPALTLGIFGGAIYARLARDELARELGQEYVRMARAKGASRLRALVVHALRNALLPLGTLAALELGALVGGAVVTEKLFRWPGLGQMTVEALVNRDGPVIAASVLLAATATVLATVVVDLGTTLLDPRLRSPRR